MKPIARVFLYGIAVVCIGFGLLFVLQGADFVRWPASSFMIGARDWIEKGIVIMLAGFAALAAAIWK